MTPESELALIVFGSVLVTIMHNKGLGSFASMLPTMGGSSDSKPAQATPPLARPVVPPVAPSVPSAPSAVPTTVPMTFNPMPNVPNASANMPAIPVMKRPVATTNNVEEPKKKTVALASKNVARKTTRQPEDVLDL